MVILNKWALFGYGNLDARWTPLNHICETFLFNPLKTFMDLSWVDISLDDIHN